MSKQPPWGRAGLPHPGPRGGPRGVRLTLPGLTGWLSGPLLPPVAERGRWGGVAGSQGPAGVAFSSRCSRVLRPPRVTPVPCWLVVGGGGHGPLCVVHTHMQMTQDRVCKRRSLPPPSVSLGHEPSACGTLGPSVCPWICPTLVAGLDIGGKYPPLSLRLSGRLLDFGVSF